MQDCQESNDDQDDETAVEQILQDVPPEKADNDKDGNSSQNDKDPPDNLVVWDRGKIYRHSDLLNGNIQSGCGSCWKARNPINRVDLPALDDLTDEIGPEAIAKVTIIRHR
jgi:hypothetical protein